MDKDKPTRSLGTWIGVGLAGLLALYLVTVVYAVGEVLLASTLLIILALGVWTYTSRHTMAVRYLFPALAAALVFVVFPMLYTIAVGFTNYSTKNLLDFPRAQQYLLDETYAGEGTTYSYTLWNADHQYWLRLQDTNDEKRNFVAQGLGLQDTGGRKVEVKMQADVSPSAAIGEQVTFKDIIGLQKALKQLVLVLPDNSQVRMSSMREFGPVLARYKLNPDGSLTDNQKGGVVKPNFKTGFFETADGEQVVPGFSVYVGFEHFKRIFTDQKFIQPFVRIFIWTVAFSGLTVFLASSLGLLLAALLNWEALRFRGVFRFLLFLPYAVPGFISILIFKGLFNQNLGEVNLILGNLFGVRPQWFADPLLAKIMILTVNTWLGFPYMMVVCMGLIKAIPSDLYEASAVAGAGPLMNFFEITMPLILKPLTPLLISSFAFNFNNFVLITLLTGGRPDFLDITVPAGTTDILVSYAFRIAFQDSGQQFGLACAISTVIFLLVATITLIQMRFTKIAQTSTR